MKNQNVFALVLVVIGLTGTGCVQAQTEKTVQGQYGPRPYITHAELENTSVGGTVSGKSSSSRTTFKDVLTMASMKEVTHHFGEPTSTEYNRFPEGSSTDYIATLTYDGLSLEYRKRGGKLRLQTLKITSEDRFLRVGGVKLQPGMSTDSLSAVMQTEIGDDGEGFLRVTPPGKSEDLRSTRYSNATIELWTETHTRTRIVEKVRFHRIAP